MNNLRGDIKKIICSDLNLDGVAVSLNTDYLHTCAYTSSSATPPLKIRVLLVDSTTSHKYEQEVINFTSTSITFKTNPNSHELVKFDELELDLTYIASNLKLKTTTKMIAVKTVNTLLAYDTGCVKLPISNLLYPRIKLGFPKWGSIEKNDISNGSKLLEPLFTPFYDSYHKMIKYNIKSKFKKGYEKYLNIYFGDNPEIVLKENEEGLKEKLYESGSIETLPRKTKLKPNSGVETLSRIIIDPELDQEFDFSPFENKYIYTKRVNIEEADQGYVRIKGRDAYGEKIEETIEVTKEFFTVSRKKFFKIDSIISSDNILISNYIDCRFDHYYIKDIKTIAPIVDQDLFAFNPKVLKAKNNEFTKPVLHIHNMKKELSEIAYKFDIESNTNRITSLFIDEHLRAIWTDGEKLYSSVLHHDLSKDIGNHPSNNNNEVVKILDKNTCIGDWVDAVIDTDAWPSKTPMIIQIRNKDSVKYFDQETETFIDTIKYFYPQTNNRYIELSVKVENDSPYIFSVVSDNFTKRYLASSHTNMLRSIDSKDCLGTIIIIDEVPKIVSNFTLTTTSVGQQDSDKIRVIIEPQALNTYDWEFNIAGQYFGSNGSTCKEDLYKVISNTGNSNTPVIFEINRHKMINEFSDGEASCYLNINYNPLYNTEDRNHTFNLILSDCYGSVIKSITIPETNHSVTVPITIDRETKRIDHAS